MNEEYKKSFFDKMHLPVANAVMEFHKLLDGFEDSYMKQYAKQKIDEAYLWATQIFQKELMKEAERLAAEAKEKIDNPVADVAIDVVKNVVEDAIVH